MKKPVIKALAAGLVFAGITFVTSCNNKHETDGSTNEQGTELTGPTDTTATTGGDNSEDGTATGTGSGSGSGATGTGASGSGTSGGSGNTGGGGSTGSGGDTGSAKGTGGSASGNGSAGTYSPSTDPIENTSRPSATRDGKPIISSGSAGSGMGTGTGSTGNNSRVRTAEEQRS